MRKTAGMNKHQKAVHRVKEQRICREEVEELLERSVSSDPEDRLMAAEFLCPCHVRRRIDAVWEALFRLLEDGDPRVRRAAWHTLDDGGKPTDDAALANLARICEKETDPGNRKYAEGILRKFAVPQKELTAMKLVGRPQQMRRGRCDFCGESNVPVERDLETMIPTDDLPRAAWICGPCAKAA